MDVNVTQLNYEDGTTGIHLQGQGFSISTSTSGTELTSTTDLGVMTPQEVTDLSEKTLAETTQDATINLDKEKDQ